MMENKYTSFELSKKLQENGFDKEKTNYALELPNVDGNIIHAIMKLGYSGITRTEAFYTIINGQRREVGFDYMESKGLSYYPSYDILNDLCVKYAKEMFGAYSHETFNICCTILNDLILGRDVSKYIWENCLFNPKNKKNAM